MNIYIVEYYSHLPRYLGRPQAEKQANIEKITNLPFSSKC